MSRRRAFSTLPGFAHEAPTLADLLEDLPHDVVSEMLGKAFSVGDDLHAATSALTEATRVELYSKADLVLAGGHLDMEDLEPIAKKNSIKLTKNTANHALVYALIEKLGLHDARVVLTDAIKSADVATTGTFADFQAPDTLAKLLDIDRLQLKRGLEDYLERHLATDDTRRLVKVHPQYVTKTRRLMLTVYYQRPPADGRDITTDKHLTTRAFARSAGDMFCYLQHVQRKTRITFKSPSTKLAAKIRQGLGELLWQKIEAVSEAPSSTYDLNVFKDSERPIPVCNKYATTVEKVLLSEIKVEAASGNILSVSSRGSHGDARQDFAELSSGAPILIEKSSVTEVTLRFIAKGDDKRRVLARARVQRDRVHVDDQHLAMVEAHLREWDVRE